jgi:hypothetical protein
MHVFSQILDLTALFTWLIADGTDDTTAVRLNKHFSKVQMDKYKDMFFNG